MSSDSVSSNLTGLPTVAQPMILGTPDQSALISQLLQQAMLQEQIRANASVTLPFAYALTNGCVPMGNLALLSGLLNPTNPLMLSSPILCSLSGSTDSQVKNADAHTIVRAPVLYNVPATSKSEQGASPSSEQSPPDRIVASYAAAAHAAALVNRQPVSKAAENFLAASIPRSRHLKRSRSGAPNQASRMTPSLMGSNVPTPTGPNDGERCMGWSRVIDRKRMAVEYIAPDGSRLHNQSEVVTYFRTKHSASSPAESHYDELVASCFNFDPNTESVELVDNMSFLTALQPVTAISKVVTSLQTESSNTGCSSPKKSCPLPTPQSSHDTTIHAETTCGGGQPSSESAVSTSHVSSTPVCDPDVVSTTTGDDPLQPQSSSPSTSSAPLDTNNTPTKMTTETVTIDSLGVPGSVVPSVIPPSLISSTSSERPNVSAQTLETATHPSTSSLDHILLQAQQQHQLANYVAALTSKVLPDGHPGATSLNTQLLSILMAANANNPLIPVQNNCWTGSVNNSFLPIHFQPQLSFVPAVQQQLAFASMLPRQQPHVLTGGLSQPTIITPQLQAYLAALQCQLPHGSH